MHIHLILYTCSYIICIHNLCIYIMYVSSLPKKNNQSSFNMEVSKLYYI